MSIPSFAKAIRHAVIVASLMAFAGCSSRPTDIEHQFLHQFLMEFADYCKEQPEGTLDLRKSSAGEWMIVCSSVEARP